MPHVILRIRFHNSYSKNGSILYENLDALAHALAHAEAGVTSYGSLRRLKIQVVQKVKWCFLPFSIPYQAEKIANGKVIPPNPVSQERYKIYDFDISLVFETIDSHTGTCYSLLPFKGRTILLLLNSILLRSINPQTEFPCMCIHRDSKIKYQYTLFENRRNVYLFRDIYPILYYVVLLSHRKVMITNTNNIKYKGLNLDFNLHTYVGMTVEFGDSTDEWLLAIYDLEMAQEVEDLENFDALHMHDDVEKVMTRFETFGSKFSGDIAKLISKSFNMNTPSEVQIRANGE